MESNSLYTSKDGLLKNNLNPSPSMYEFKNDIENPRYDETHCYDHNGNQLNHCFYKTKENDPEINMKIPFGRGVNYIDTNTCMPNNYFKYTDVKGEKKSGCILKKI